MNRGIIQAFTASGASRICTFQMNNFERPTLSGDMIAVKYVQKGEVGFELNKRQNEILQQQYFLVDRGSDNAAFISAAQPAEGLCIFIDNQVISDIFFTITHKDEDSLSDPDAFRNASLDIVEGLYNASDDIFSNSLKQLSIKSSFNNGLLGEFSEEDFYVLVKHLVHQQQHIYHLVQRVAAKKSLVRKENFRRVQQARNYIHDNLGETLGIEELAKIANMSPFHFMRSFKRIYKMPAYQYIIEQRLQWALQLLLQRKLTMTEIARSTGFEDIFTFSKAFKKRFGVAPSFFSTNKE